MKYLLLYLLVINIALFALMGIDKRRAMKSKWRIRERTLFLLAAIGGSIGGILGMKVFRHKTCHRKFRFGFPAILICQLILAIFLIYISFYS